MRELIRQIVDGYRSLKLEGQDEGYVQFTAREPDTRQPVEIKVLPRLLGQDPEISERFRDVSRAIRQLNHPNIAPVRKVGDESGLPYIITRSIERARPLTERLDQPWAVDTAADVVMQTGQALEHAYNKGVIHGGLTPDQVIIEDSGRVLVKDIGLAEVMDLVGAHVRRAVSPYLPPERLAGQTADAASDVYSLAAILYSLLTKRKPQFVEGRVLPASRFNPDVPPKMDEVLARALDPDPTRRHPNVKVLVADLGSVSLVPPGQREASEETGGRCPNCGAEGQQDNFCRKCGTPLRSPKVTARTRPYDSHDADDDRPLRVEDVVLDEPIQITRVDVGHVPVRHDVIVNDTAISQPMMVATGEQSDLFPEPLPMPQMETEDLWPILGDRPIIAMPEPPEMPSIDWAELAPPMPEVPKIEDIPIGEERDD